MSILEAKKIVVAELKKQTNGQKKSVTWLKLKLRFVRDENLVIWRTQKCETAWAMAQAAEQLEAALK